MLSYAIAYSQTDSLKQEQHLENNNRMDLSFCTFINSSNQDCVFNNTKFITPKDSTHAKLFMMIRSYDTLGVEKLIYKIYAIDRFGTEVFLNMIGQEIKSSWRSVWQPYDFTSPGKYMVKVYKDDEHMLISKGFEFFNN